MQSNGHGQRCLEELEHAFLEITDALLRSCAFEGLPHGTVPCYDHRAPRDQGHWLCEDDRAPVFLLALRNLGINDFGRERHVK